MIHRDWALNIKKFKVTLRNSLLLFLDILPEKKYILKLVSISPILDFKWSWLIQDRLQGILYFQKWSFYEYDHVVLFISKTTLGAGYNALQEDFSASALLMSGLDNALLSGLPCALQYVYSEKRLWPLLTDARITVAPQPAFDNWKCHQTLPNISWGGERWDKSTSYWEPLPYSNETTWFLLVAYFKNIFSSS